MRSAQAFLALHRPGAPLLLPNPWDVGSARLFASLGFEALATTSGGFAATKGRFDGAVTLDEVVTHAVEIAAATELPVNVDFEDGFSDAPDGVAANVTRLATTGVAGCSVEDFTPRADDPIYDLGHAAERVAAATEAARAAATPLAVTARAENYLHGRPDLADTIARLQAYQDAGADVLYAPGVSTVDEIRSLVASVDRPVNVLTFSGTPDVATLASLGVARISVGALLTYVSFGAVAEAARELREQGTYGFMATAGVGRSAITKAFPR